MNKFILLNFLLMLSMLVFAEKLVGEYYSSYWNKKFDIEASEIKKEKFSIYIQVPAKNDNTKAMLEFSSSDIEDLKGTLLAIKDKFNEWSQIAKDNNVTDMSKDMDFKLPSSTICWYGSKWFFSFGHRLQPRFLVLDDGRHIITFLKKATSSSNRYIDETIYWVFASPEEIEDFISVLDIEKIKEKLVSDEKKSELFK